MVLRIVDVVRHFYITFGPQDLSRTIDRVGNMHFGTIFLEMVIQTPQKVYGSFENMFQKIHGLFEVFV